MAQPRRENANRRLLGDFLVDQLPEDLVGAFLRLAGLDYPIPDRDALRQQLAKVAGKEHSEKSALEAEALVRVFRTVDFGLDSTHNALEKFCERAIGMRLGRDFPLPRFELPFRERDPRVERFPPEFGDDECGRAARRLFLELQERPSSGPYADVLEELRALQRAKLCRGTMPEFPDSGCGNEARMTFADLVMHLTPEASERMARMYLAFCEATRSPFNALRFESGSVEPRRSGGC
jgi:hypothetical protein